MGMGEYGTYEVDGLDPVVLIGGHFELFENVGGFADLEDFDCRRVRIIDLR